MGQAPNVGVGLPQDRSSRETSRAVVSAKGEPGRVGQMLYLFVPLSAGAVPPPVEPPLQLRPKVPAEESLAPPEEKRIDPMPLPPATTIGHADDGNGEHSLGISELIAEAEELRRVVHDADGRFIAAL